MFVQCLFCGSNGQEWFLTRKYLTVPKHIGWFFWAPDLAQPLRTEGYEKGGGGWVDGLVVGGGWEG